MHDSLKVYDNVENGISANELNKWRNKFKHPLVLPIHLEDDTILLADYNHNNVNENLNNNFPNLGLNTEYEASRLENIIMVDQEISYNKKLIR